MDADVKQAFDDIKLQIQSLTNLVMGIKGGSGTADTTTHLHAPPLPFHGFESADADWSQWTDLIGGKRYFNKDYWFVGIPGAQKGVDLDLWGAANTMYGMMGESKPHLYVVTLGNPQPVNGNWQLVTKSAADAGWIDGSAYIPNAAFTGGQKFAAWDAAGRPSVSADGFLLQRGGDYVTNSSGQKVPPGADPGFKVG